MHCAQPTRRWESSQLTSAVFAWTPPQDPVFAGPCYQECGKLSPWHNRIGCSPTTHLVSRHCELGRLVKPEPHATPSGLRRQAYG